MASSVLFTSIVALLALQVSAASCADGSCLENLDDETNLVQIKSQTKFRELERAERDAKPEELLESEEAEEETSGEVIDKSFPAANEKDRVAFGKTDPSSTGDKPIQKGYKNFQELHTAAKAAQANLKTLAEKVANQTGMVMSLPPGANGGIKSVKRCEDKINKSYGGDFSKITDVCRVTFHTPKTDECNMAMVVKAYGILKPQVKFVKNKFAKPQKNGYCDVNAIVEVGAGNGLKMFCEVQVHILPLMEVKNGDEHKQYEVKDALERAEATKKANGDQAGIIQGKVGGQMLECIGARMYEKVWKQCFDRAPDVKTPCVVGK